MFNNPYAYNQQNTVENIDEQINRLQKIKTQMQQPMQPTNLTQNFQLAPTNRDVIRYANSMDDVQREMVIGDTPYFSKDMSVVWIKNIKGEVKTYELTEIIPKDEKDLQIELLQQQINELKGKIDNEQRYTNVITTKDTTNTSRNDEPIREQVKNDEPTSIQRISAGKKK